MAQACESRVLHGSTYERRPAIHFLTSMQRIELPGPATEISASSNHARAVVGGKLHCWGGNRYGELGTGRTACRETAVDLTAAIIAAVKAP